MSIPGIDVSDNNGAIDWPAVKASGIGFVYLKLTEGVSYVNAYAAQWVAEAYDAGLLVGLYHYALPAWNSDPDAEGAWFDQHAAPLVRAGTQLHLDLETYQYSRALPQDCGPWAERWMEGRVARFGARPMLYTNTDVIRNYGVNTQAIAQSGLWLASWGTKQPAAPSPWTFIATWQRSATGTVPGITTAVDLDTFNGDAEAFAKYGISAAPAPKPKPTFDDHARLQLCGYLAGGSGPADLIAWIGQFQE